MTGAMTKAAACEMVAHSLREFGYPDVTAQMTQDILAAWLTGKRGVDLPHGIIGMMAEAQFDDVEKTSPGLLAEME